MKALDFNSLQQPTWTITLKDDDKTVVNLTAPTVELVDKLLALSREISSAIEAKDGRAIKAAYGVIAEVMNCNNDLLTFTAEELRDKYKLNFLDLLSFTKGFLGFIEEIKNAKN